MKFFSIVAVLALSGHAVSPLSMINDGSRTQYGTPSVGYTTCHYEQLGGSLRIKVVVSGMCPLTIKYDPTTGTWTR